MEKSVIFEKVKDVIIQNTTHLLRREIVLGASIKNDLAIGSFDFAAIMLDIEKEYNIHISEKDEKQLKTVKDMVDYLWMRGERELSVNNPVKRKLQ